jgi:hypothetical protein
VSKSYHNREKRDFGENLLLFVNRWRYFDVLGLLLHNLTRETLCIPQRASKPDHNREKPDFQQNSLLFLNRWRYFDVLGILLLNFTQETLCMPHSESKPDHNREKRDFDRNSLLFLKRLRYFDVLGLLSSTIHEKRCAYRIEPRKRPITEKNAILNKIRCYSTIVGDILTF